MSAGQPATKMKLRSSQFRLGFLIHDVSRLRRTVVDKAFRPLAVTRSQWWVLANLSRHSGRPMMQTELAKVLDVGKVALGSLLDRLEANGYIARRSDSLDRRVKLVELTPDGGSLLETLQARASVLNAAMLEGISPEDIMTTDRVLYTIKQRLLEMGLILGGGAGGGAGGGGATRDRYRPRPRVTLTHIGDRRAISAPSC